MDVVEHEVKTLDDQQLLIYYNTHKNLNNDHPNFFYDYKQKVAHEQIIHRKLEDGIGSP